MNRNINILLEHLTNDKFYEKILIMVTNHLNFNYYFTFRKTGGWLFIV